VKSPRIFLIASLFPLALHAAPYGENTAEQKEVLGSEAVLKEATDKLNQNCGTAASTTINWRAYDSIKGLSPEMKDKRDMDNLYRMAGIQNESHILYIADACKDSLFKANVAKKLRSIVVTPRAGNISAKEPSHVFKLNNGVLNVTYHIFNNNTTTDTASKLF
jgi:hypothetical protein